MSYNSGQNILAFSPYKAKNPIFHIFLCFRTSEARPVMSGFCEPLPWVMGGRPLWMVHQPILKNQFLLSGEFETVISREREKSNKE